MTGLTAEAAVERVQSDNRARMMRQTDPYLRERLHDLDDLANRLMRQLVGRDHAPPREQLPDNAILVARSMGPAALLDYDRKKLRGAGAGGRRADLARRRSWRARSASRRSGRSPTPPASSIRATRSSSTARWATSTCARPPTWRRTTPIACGCARAARRSTRELRDKPMRHQGRREDRAAAQCRPAGRPAAHRRDRRRPASACSAPSCSSWSRPSCRAPPSSSGSIARCSTPPATGR